MSASAPDKQDVSEVAIEKFTYQWKIENFKYLHKRPGDYIDSPVFSFGTKNKINWHLRLYPNGEKKKYENFLSLFLDWEHISILRGEFCLSLINNKQKIVVKEKEDLEKKSINHLGIGFVNFVIRDRVFAEASELLHNGCLTIQCEIIVSLDNISQMKKNKKRKLDLSSGPNWHEQLFLEEDLSDVKLIVTSCNRSLPAHRSVLAACSPVFNAMFKTNMREQKLGEVNIDDGEYEVIKEMLRFIYINKVENLNTIVFELVKLADKYQIVALMKVCEKELMNQITVDNVFKVIATADCYNIEQLKNDAINFASLHLKDVLKSTDYKSPMYAQALYSVLDVFSQQ